MASFHVVFTSFSGKFNRAFLSFKTYIRREQRVPTSRNANLIFVVSSLLNLLQIKFQGNSNELPFQTHPRTCSVAIITLLTYGFAYDAEQRFSETHPNYANAARRAMGLFGSLLNASLASILFPGWVQPILYLVYLMFYADELIDWLLRRCIGELEEVDQLPV